MEVISTKIKTRALTTNQERLDVLGKSQLTYTNVYGDSIDELVINAVYNICRCGQKVEVRAGTALQAYGVNYILTNPRARLHTLRDGAIKYLCREFLAYFSGSLIAAEGLANASKFWNTIADANGKINSNYGYHVFHELVHKCRSQFNWVIEVLTKNLDSRRAIININQTYHKSDTKDFPCTVAMQFFIKNYIVNCEVISRSTDVITGLPYDMGFFSLVHEMVYQKLVENGYYQLELGNTIMKTSFTQIYDKSSTKVQELLQGNKVETTCFMPKVSNVDLIISDIYNKGRQSEIMDWIIKNA